MIIRGYDFFHSDYEDSDLQDTAKPDLNFSREELQKVQDLEEIFEDTKIKALNAKTMLEAGMNFDRVKEKYGSRSYNNQTILTLPDILENEIKYAKNPDTKKALSFLKDCIILWSGTEKTMKPKPYWTDWNRATDFELAQDAIKEIKFNLNNDAAKKELIKVVQPNLKGKKEDFDFTQLPPDKWKDNL